MSASPSVSSCSTFPSSSASATSASLPSDYSTTTTAAAFPASNARYTRTPPVASTFPAVKAVDNQLSLSLGGIQLELPAFRILRDFSSARSFVSRHVCLVCFSNQESEAATAAEVTGVYGTSHLSFLVVEDNNAFDVILGNDSHPHDEEVMSIDWGNQRDSQLVWKRVASNGKVSNVNMQWVTASRPFVFMTGNEVLSQETEVVCRGPHDIIAAAATTYFNDPRHSDSFRFNTNMSDDGLAAVQGSIHPDIQTAIAGSCTDAVRQACQKWCQDLSELIPPQGSEWLLQTQELSKRMLTGALDSVPTIRIPTQWTPEYVPRMVDQIAFMKYWCDRILDFAKNLPQIVVADFGDETSYDVVYLIILHACSHLRRSVSQQVRSTSPVLY